MGCQWAESALAELALERYVLPKLDLPKGADHAPGVVHGAVSAVTGRAFNYFAPDPLPKLIERLPVSNGTHRQDEYTQGSSLLLLRSLCSRGGLVPVDMRQAALASSLILGRHQLRTTEDFLSLARHVSSKSATLREEIVFSGGPSASLASMVYAPSGLVPGLVQSIGEGISMARACDPVLAASVAGFFCTHVHPFLDGNGRWSRLVAIAAGNGAFPAVCATLFQALCLPFLADHVWPQARQFGLRHYLQLSASFHQRLVEELSRCSALPVARQLFEVAKASARTASALDDSCRAIFLSGAIEVNRVRRTHGLSKKSAEGFLSRLDIAGHGWIDFEQGRVSTHRLLDSVDKIALAVSSEIEGSA